MENSFNCRCTNRDRCWVDVKARNERGDTPLPLAICDSTAAANIQALLNAGANVNTQDNRLLTPLHLTASFSTSKVNQVLLDAGTDVNANDNAGFTPRHSAAFLGEL